MPQIHEFEVYNNWLDNDLAQHLSDRYSNTHYADWKMRACGRYIAFLEPGDAEDYLEALYFMKDGPFYKNKKMMRNAHIYLNGFAPGSILVDHREKSIGGCSYYLTDMPTGGGNIMWFDSDEQQQQYATDYESLIDNNVSAEFNKAVTWGGNSVSEPIFNPWHRITKNNSDVFRVSIQMFWGNDHVTAMNREYSESKNYTKQTAANGTLEIHDTEFALQYHNMWLEHYADFAQSMEKS
jgi:hypothetical protein